MGGTIEQQHHQARSPAMIFHRNFDRLSLKDGILVGVARCLLPCRSGSLALSSTVTSSTPRASRTT
ncbi:MULTISPECIES: hypothetical protein [unclassified Microcoleus]|uniref:hypothetical protein n=1 Tax=unclassified Microcoleus TaxID=2642155 RepID=UPI002FD5A2D6